MEKACFDGREGAPAPPLFPVPSLDPNCFPILQLPQIGIPPLNFNFVDRDATAAHLAFSVNNASGSTFLAAPPKKRTRRDEQSDKFAVPLGKNRVEFMNSEELKMAYQKLHAEHTSLTNQNSELEETVKVLKMNLITANQKVEELTAKNARKDARIRQQFDIIMESEKKLMESAREKQEWMSFGQYAQCSNTPSTSSQES